MRKPAFCICENKDADQLCGISAFVFATPIVQSLFFQNRKFQASSHLLWLYSPVCVVPGRKPRRQVLSRRSSLLSRVLKHTYNTHLHSLIIPSVLSLPRLIESIMGFGPRQGNLKQVFRLFKSHPRLCLG